MITMEEMAKTVEEMAYKTERGNPFKIDATLYACDDDGAYFIASGADPYELIEGSARPAQINAVALVVTGFGSPYSEDDSNIRPSEHPERFRIRIVTVKGPDGFHTLMRREDDPDVVIDMAGESRGAICEALNEWWTK